MGLMWCNNTLEGADSTEITEGAEEILHNIYFINNKKKMF